MLRETDVNIISLDVCTQHTWYGEYGNDVCIDKSMICAGRKHGVKDTCTGDSGGPLQCLTPDGRWKLAGVTSFGDLICGTPRKPGVYTRIASYLEWIKRFVDGRKLTSSCIQSVDVK